MAIAFDAASTGRRWASGDTTYTQAHTCAGSDFGIRYVQITCFEALICFPLK